MNGYARSTFVAKDFAAESDIGRIFAKGFTGENGRNGAKSTGIGLYLCRKLCEKMNLKLEACSKKGEENVKLLLETSIAFT